MHHFVLMQTTFLVNFILHSSFSLMGFSLPIMIPSPFLLWCFVGFVFFFSLLQTVGSFLEKRPKVRILLKIGGDSPKTSIFPFIEDFPSSLPTILGNDQMGQFLPAVYSPASCSRTLAAGWPFQVSLQLLLDTKEHELLLHPVNIASCPSNGHTLGQNQCNCH